MFRRLVTSAVVTTTAVTTQAVTFTTTTVQTSLVVTTAPGEKYHRAVHGMPLHSNGL